MCVLPYSTWKDASPVPHLQAPRGHVLCRKVMPPAASLRPRGTAQHRRPLGPPRQLVVVRPRLPPRQAAPAHLVPANLVKLVQPEAVLRLRTACTTRCNVKFIWYGMDGRTTLERSITASLPAQVLPNSPIVQTSFTSHQYKPYLAASAPGRAPQTVTLAFADVLLLVLLLALPWQRPSQDHQVRACGP